MSQEVRQSKNPLIWDWPLRIWHWLIAICASIALTTGLVKEWDAMTLHRWAGIAVVALLSFRLLWGIWGGTYSLFRNYRTTPNKVILHFRGRLEPEAHTPPGIVLALSMMMALGLQALAGLFASDDVFIEGPFARHVPDDFVEFATDLHHQVWWAIVFLIGIHLTAHAVYGGFLRSSIPLSMFTGRKQVSDQSTEFSLVRTVLTYGIAIAVFCVILQFLQ
ncbi:MAG: cytochrome b/b6 domain-containing protein [Gammaproteobacteria bacterium]|nr:cytochrome b/b6 domain-containing protein [Gammaproteobacteria bacterium]